MYTVFARNLGVLDRGGFFIDLARIYALPCTEDLLCL